MQECDHIDVAETGEPLAVPPISPSDPFEFVGDGTTLPLVRLEGGRLTDAMITLACSRPDRQDHLLLVVFLMTGQQRLFVKRQ